MKTKKINAEKYLGFVWDGCHKIYLIEKNQNLDDINPYDREEMQPMDELPAVWRKTCPLRFINTYGTLKTIIPQDSGVEKIIITRGRK